LCCSGKALIGRQDLLQQGLQFHLQLEAHLAGLDFFAVQDVVDQPDQPLAVALGDADEVLAMGGKSPATPPQTRPSEPRMEVSGVRSSWLTVETNSLFMRSMRLSSVTSVPSE
jgi:hypothetical protein